MADIIDIREAAWERLCAAVRLCQREPTDENKAAVKKAEADYVALFAREAAA